MAVQQKDLPEWRWPWDPLFIAFTYRLTVTCMPCNHVFHDVCISSWLLRSARCPVCRFDLKKPKAFDYIARIAQSRYTGASLGNLYCDPMGSINQKFTARQRWTPSPVQLQILERIFEQGTGTPSKQKIKEMTAELAQHGQISEINVCNLKTLDQISEVRSEGNVFDVPFLTVRSI